MQSFRTLVVYNLALFFKRSLLVEMWDDDQGQSSDDEIDNFIFPLSSPLNKFNPSDSLTRQGHYGVGNITLNYGNLTIDENSSVSVVRLSFVTSSYTGERNLLN